MEIQRESPETEAGDPPTVNVATSPCLSLEANEVWPEEAGGVLPAICEEPTPSIPRDVNVQPQLGEHRPRPDRRQNPRTPHRRHCTPRTRCRSPPQTNRLRHSSQNRHPACTVIRCVDRATQTTRGSVELTRRRQRPPRRTTSGAHRAARENTSTLVRREVAAGVESLVQPTNFRVAIHPHTSRRMVTAQDSAGRRLQPAEFSRVPEAVRRGVREAGQLNAQQRQNRRYRVWHADGSFTRVRPHQVAWLTRDRR